MKKTILVLQFLAVSLFSFAQVNLQAVIKPGTQLIYGVEAGEQQYDFIVTVKALVPAVVFDWKMTNSNNSSGTITHTAAAMAGANTLYNYFSPGEKTLDDYTLSVWISKSAFNALTKGAKTQLLKMNTNEEPKKMVVSQEDPTELKLIVNGEKETVEMFTAKAELSSNAAPEDQVSFSFSNNGRMPVILQMRNGFFLTLKEIKTK
ncbi:MAG: hypothetical protein U0X40_11610 [Ferruginibacter sp.]